MSFGRYTCGVQGHTVSVGVSGLHKKEGDFGVKPQSKTSNCLLMIHQVAESINDFPIIKLDEL